MVDGTIQKGLGADLEGKVEYMDEFDRRLNRSRGVESTVEIAVEFFDKVFTPRSVVVGIVDYFGRSEIDMYTLSNEPPEQGKELKTETVRVPVSDEEMRIHLKGIEFYFLMGEYVLQMNCFIEGTLINRITASARSSDPNRFVKFTPKEVEIFRRYAEKVSAKAADQQQMVMDHLTGLFNKHYGGVIFEREYERAESRGKPLTAILFDLDDFKGVNDTQGHSYGDRVLSQLGRLIRSNIRTYDLPIRDGGDEIIILLQDTPLGVGIERAEELRKLVKREIVGIDGKPVTVSAGVAAYPFVQGLNNLKMHADRSMYVAKGLGKDNVCYSNGSEIIQYTRGRSRVIQATYMPDSVAPPPNMPSGMVELKTA